MMIIIATLWLFFAGGTNRLVQLLVSFSPSL